MSALRGTRRVTSMVVEQRAWPSLLGHTGVGGNIHPPAAVHSLVSTSFQLNSNPEGIPL